MHLIVQSLFLKALTFALLNSIWQMALAWLIVILALRIFKLSASQKFNIAFASQLTGFVLFIYSLVYFYKDTSTSLLFKSNFFYADKLNSFKSGLTPYIDIAYITVLTYQFSKLFFSYNITQRLRKHNLQKMPAINRIFVQQITALLSLKKNVSIYLSSSIKCPLTLGFFKPVILVPFAAVNHLTKEQMEAVLLHEMAHIKRYDYLLNLIQSFIEKIFFFNIFLRMIQDIIEHERENACDDFVLQFKYNAFHYAEALLKLGRLQTMSSFAMASSGKKENSLLIRIKRLIHRNSYQNINFGFKSLAYCFLSLIFLLPLTIALYPVNNLLSTTLNKKNTSVTSNIKKHKPDVKTYTVTNKQPTVLPRNSIAKSSNKSLLKKDDSSSEVDAITDNNINTSGYFVDVNHLTDSLKQTVSIDALNKNIILNEDTYKKAMSYQNFKQLEAMLYASGKSITITEDPASKNSYQKLITIESKDAQGNENIYKVIVEVYQ